MIYFAPLLYAYLLWLLFIMVMSLKAKWNDLPLDVKRILVLYKGLYIPRKVMRKLATFRFMKDGFIEL